MRLSRQRNPDAACDSKILPLSGFEATAGTAACCCRQFAILLASWRQFAARIMRIERLGTNGKDSEQGTHNRARAAIRNGSIIDEVEARARRPDVNELR